MFDIPMGARHIVIEENETSPHVIGELFSQSFFFQPQTLSQAFSSRLSDSKQTFSYDRLQMSCYYIMEYIKFRHTSHLCFWFL